MPVRILSQAKAKAKFGTLIPNIHERVKIHPYFFNHEHHSRIKRQGKTYKREYFDPVKN